MEGAEWLRHNNQSKTREIEYLKEELAELHMKLLKCERRVRELTAEKLAREGGATTLEVCGEAKDEDAGWRWNPDSTLLNAAGSPLTAAARGECHVSEQGQEAKMPGSIGHGDGTRPDDSADNGSAGLPKEIWRAAVWPTHASKPLQLVADGDKAEGKVEGIGDSSKESVAIEADVGETTLVDASEGMKGCERSGGKSQMVQESGEETPAAAEAVGIVGVAGAAVLPGPAVSAVINKTAAAESSGLVSRGFSGTLDINKLPPVDLCEYLAAACSKAQRQGVGVKKEESGAVRGAVLPDVRTRTGGMGTFGGIGGSGSVASRAAAVKREGSYSGGVSIGPPLISPVMVGTMGLGGAGKAGMACPSLLNLEALKNEICASTEEGGGGKRGRILSLLQEQCKRIDEAKAGGGCGGAGGGGGLKDRHFIEVTTRTSGCVGGSYGIPLEDRLAALGECVGKVGGSGVVPLNNIGVIQDGGGKSIPIQMMTPGSSVLVPSNPVPPPRLGLDQISESGPEGMNQVAYESTSVACGEVAKETPSAPSPHVPPMCHPHWARPLDFSSSSPWGPHTTPPQQALLLHLMQACHPDTPVQNMRQGGGGVGGGEAFMGGEGLSLRCGAALNGGAPRGSVGGGGFSSPQRLNKGVEVAGRGSGGGREEECRPENWTLGGSGGSESVPIRLSAFADCSAQRGGGGMNGPFLSTPPPDRQFCLDRWQREAQSAWGPLSVSQRAVQEVFAATKEEAPRVNTNSSVCADFFARAKEREVVAQRGRKRGREGEEEEDVGKRDVETDSSLGAAMGEGGDGEERLPAEASTSPSNTPPGTVEAFVRSGCRSQDNAPHHKEWNAMGWAGGGAVAGKNRFLTDSHWGRLQTLVHGLYEKKKGQPHVVKGAQHYGAFLEDCCLWRSGIWLSASVLLGAYHQWAQTHPTPWKEAYIKNLQQQAMILGALGLDLKKKHFHCGSRLRTVGMNYRGITLKPEVLALAVPPGSVSMGGGEEETEMGMYSDEEVEGEGEETSDMPMSEMRTSERRTASKTAGRSDAEEGQWEGPVTSMAETGVRMAEGVEAGEEAGEVDPEEGGMGPPKGIGAVKILGGAGHGRPKIPKSGQLQSCSTFGKEQNYPDLSSGPPSLMQAMSGQGLTGGRPSSSVQGEKRHPLKVEGKPVQVAAGEEGIPNCLRRILKAVGCKSVPEMTSLHLKQADGVDGGEGGGVGEAGEGGSIGLEEKGESVLSTSKRCLVAQMSRSAAFVTGAGKGAVRLPGAGGGAIGEMMGNAALTRSSSFGGGGGRASMTVPAGLCRGGYGGVGEKRKYENGSGGSSFRSTLVRPAASRVMPGGAKTWIPPPVVENGEGEGKRKVSPDREGRMGESKGQGGGKQGNGSQGV